jgi:hypothetical protein
MKKIIFILAAISIACSTFAQVSFNQNLAYPRTVEYTGRMVVRDTVLTMRRGSSDSLRLRVTPDTTYLTSTNPWKFTPELPFVKNAGNGLTKVGDTVKLGGTLESNSIINVGSSSFVLINSDTTQFFTFDDEGFFAYVDLVELTSGSDVYITSGNNVEFSVGNTFSVVSDSDIVLNAANDVIISATDDVSITATDDVSISSQKKITISSGDVLNINCDTLYFNVNQNVDSISVVFGSPGDGNIGLYSSKYRDWEAGFYMVLDPNENYIAKSQLFYGILDTAGLITDTRRIQASERDVEFFYLSNNNWFGGGNLLLHLDSTGLHGNMPFTPLRADSALIYAIPTPTTGATVYCTNCTPTDNSSGGVMLTYNGTLWRRHW